MGPMNRATARQVIADVKAALAPVLAKHQLVMEKDTGRFDHASLRLTLELHCLGADGEDAQARRLWEAFAEAYGVKPEDFGKTITTGRHRYKLVELNPGRSKYPFVGEDLDSHKRYKLDALSVQMALGRTGPAGDVPVTPVHVVVKPPQGEGQS